MKIELTMAERILLSRVINIVIDHATLKEHILLEQIYDLLKLEDVKYPQVTDYIKPEEVELFNTYNGKKIDEIENLEHRKVIGEAMQRQRIEEARIWSNRDENLFETVFSQDQLDLIKRFFEQDKREYDRNTHLAIVSLHKKLFN